MKERPILFSGPMVRAILDRSKTQTRRVLKVQPEGVLPMVVPFDEQCDRWIAYHGEEAKPKGTLFTCRHGVAGDLLWVRETFMGGPQRQDVCYRSACDCGFPQIDHDEYKGWKPSIHMPRWASRITLEITGVRVERLNDISEDDARAEGITNGGCLTCGGDEPCGCGDPNPSARESFIRLWNSINQKRGYGWGINPYVWVINFKRIKP